VEPVHLAASACPRARRTRCSAGLTGAGAAGLGWAGVKWNGDGTKLDGVVGKILLPSMISPIIA
jgi:hypothetical protein